MNPITSKQQKGESQDSPFCCFFELSTLRGRARKGSAWKGIVMKLEELLGSELCDITCSINIDTTHIFMNFY